MQSAFHTLSLIFFLGLSTLTHAAENPDQEPANHVGTIAVPDGLPLEGVEKSIAKAAVGRRWTITKKTKEKIIIHLVHRGYDSTLTFGYNSKEVKIYSDSWTVSKSGVKKKKKDPEGWIDNLKKDLPVFMNRELYE
jgi:hypothetical protein